MYKSLIFYCFVFFSILTHSSSHLYSQTRSNSPSSASSKSAFDLEKFLPVFEEELKKSLDVWSAPGVAVVVVMDGQIVYEKGFGVTAINNPEPITEHTIFPIASLSKPFVATLAMQLEGLGKINTDDLIEKWFPDLQLGANNASKGMVIRNLMSHNSGLPPFSGDTVIWMGYNTSEILIAMSHIPLQHPRLKKFGYQNILFGVLGLYLEKATGRSLESLMMEHVIEPLKLNDTFVGDEIAKPLSWWTRTWQRLVGSYRSVAQPHDMWHGKVNQLAYTPLFYAFLGSTGINTSVHDLGLWMIAWMQQTDKKAAWPVHNYQKMIQPGVYDDREDDTFFCHQRMKNVSYGLGWYAYTYAGTPVIGHQGGLRGTRSVMTFSMDKRVGIAVVSNFGGMRTSAMPEAIRNIFWDAYLGLPKIDWNKQLKEAMQQRQEQWKVKRAQMHRRVPAPSQPLSYYTGFYQQDFYGRMEIREENKKLIMLYRGRTIPLTHVNGNVYQYEAKDLSDFFADPENPGTIEWGGPRHEKADLCDVQLLHEGRDPFHRVEGQNKP